MTAPVHPGGDDPTPLPPVLLMLFLGGVVIGACMVDVTPGNSGPQWSGEVVAAVALVLMGLLALAAITYRAGRQKGRSDDR